MKGEKLILSLIATVIGLLAAGVAFYFYQVSKLPEGKSEKTLDEIAVTSPTPQQASNLFLTISKPKDESVSEAKVIEVLGETIPEAIVAVIGNVDHEVFTPAKNGSFATTITLGDGENILEVTAIAPNGEEITVVQTVSFSTEEF